MGSDLGGSSVLRRKYMRKYMRRRVSARLADRVSLGRETLESWESGVRLGRVWRQRESDGCKMRS